MEIYEIEKGQYQVDCEQGSFVFSKSRIIIDNVELREVWPEAARQYAKEVLIEARKNGLPI